MNECNFVRKAAFIEKAWITTMNDEKIKDVGETGARPGNLRRDRAAAKRKALEVRISLISMFVLVPVLFLIALFLVVFPRPTKSLIEKRDLATFPQFSVENYFSGKFTAGITEFYNDTVPFRDDFKNMGNQMKSMLGFRSSKSASTSGEKEGQSDSAEAVAGLISGEAGRDMPEGSGKTELPDQKDYTSLEAEGYFEGGILLVAQEGHWRAMEMFGGGSGSAYADALNDLQQKVGKDVTIYSMPAPTPGEFYTPSNFQDSTSSQAECFDGVAKKLNDGIKSINLCDTMKKHTEEPIYCRTDHHWQPLGAYYAAQRFAEEAGVPFAELDNYEKKVNEGFVGTMYTFSEDVNLLNDPEDFIYYVPSANYKAYYYDQSFNYDYSDTLFAEVDTYNSYLTFMGGDGHVVKVNTDVKNGRKLLVVKDSYGNAEIPFYTSSFEQIYVVDVRYFERNLVNFIQEMDITDVLFTMSAFSVVGENADNIQNLISQDPDSAIVDEQLTQDSGETEQSDGSSESAESGDSENSSENSESSQGGEESSSSDSAVE